MWLHVQFLFEFARSLLGPFNGRQHNSVGTTLITKLIRKESCKAIRDGRHIQWYQWLVVQFVRSLNSLNKILSPSPVNERTNIYNYWMLRVCTKEKEKHSMINVDHISLIRVCNSVSHVVVLATKETGSHYRSHQPCFWKFTISFYFGWWNVLNAVEWLCSFFSRVFCWLVGKSWRQIIICSGVILQIVDISCKLNLNVRGGSCPNHNFL